MSSIDRPPKGRLPGNSRSRNGASRRLPAPQLSRGSPRPDCRPGASRLGTIPICAPRWPMRRRSWPRRRGPISKRRAAGSRGASASRQGRNSSCLGGRFIAELSDPLPGRCLHRGGPVATNAVDDPLAALNEALSPSGCTISVAREARIAEPITLLHLADEASSYSVYSRTAIALDAGAQASFVEIFEGAHAGVQRHAATIMTLAEGARAKHVAVVGDEPGLHVETQICELAKTAELSAFGLVSGGELTRRQIFVRMTGEQAEGCRSAAWRLSTAPGAPTRRCKSFMPRRPGAAANSIARSSTMTRLACFRERLSSSKRRKRPMGR